MIATATTPETEVAKKPHLSPTQLNMIAVCGIQYERAYINKEKLPPGIAIMKGSCLHKGAEGNMRQKLQSGVDLPASQIVEIAVAHFDAMTHDSYALTEEEQSRGPSVVLGESKDIVAEMAACHANEQAPDYQPVMVEEKVLIQLPGPRDMMGVIDLADTKDRITDFKTSARKKRQGDADDSIQLTTYAAAFETKTGRSPSEVRLDAVIKTKTKTYRQVVSSQRGPRDIEVLANRINAAARVIESGAFNPALPGIWQCSAKFCGYARTCPFFNAERAAKSADAEE